MYGVYDINELKWSFFSKQQTAIDFQSEDSVRIGPHPFSFDTALEQFSNDMCVIPGVLFVTEDEFVKVVNGEEVELSINSRPEEEEEDESDDIDVEDSARPEPSEGYFEDTDEALLWFRSCCVYILDKLREYAVEREDDLEAFDYYDGFLSRIETLLDDYLYDIEDFERTSEHLYDGYFMGDDEEEEDSDE